MFDINWKVGGKKLDPANVEDEVEREIVVDLTEELHARLDGVQCPQHGTGVRSVDVAGNSFEQLGFEINGCCLKL